jgi:hypothetical protein
MAAIDHSLLIPASELAVLRTAELIDVGDYYTWRNEGPRTFAIELDARPLAVLIEDAVRGNRVYEFMTILRPGDLLHYLWINCAPAHEEVQKHVIRHKHRVRDKLDKIESECQLPFIDFDACFAPDYADDTPPHIEVWLRHRGGMYWTGKVEGLLNLVRNCQHRLRERADFLLKREIHQIDEGRHPADFLPVVERTPVPETRICFDPTFTPPVRQKIAELLKQDDVRSVSCPYRDYELWRLLAAEQIRRAENLGISPSEAFTLSGPDGGNALHGIPYESWGADVHIPYEGLCGGDLLIWPKGRRFRVPQGTTTGKLSVAATVRGCYYLLSPEDFGEVPFAVRTVVGDWVLYQSNAPYEPCDVFGVKELEAIKQRTAAAKGAVGSSPRCVAEFGRRPGYVGR